MVFYLPLFSAVLTLGLALYAWRLRRRYPWVFSFALLMLAIAEWSLGYTFELAANSLDAKLLWAKVEYLGIVSVPLLWALFAWQYVERHQWLTPKRFALLSVIPSITFLLALTNEFHGLIWEQTSLLTSGSMLVLDVTYGPWFWWGHSAYSYILLLIGSLLLLQAFGRFSSAYRWQVTILLLGALAPWLSNILHLSGLSPIPQLDLTPLAFAISGTILAWGIFRLNLFDLVPVARRTLVESMSDAMLVVNGQHEILDVNAAFLNIVQLPKTAVIGKVITDLPAELANFLTQPQIFQHHLTQTLEDLELNRQYYDVRISPLFNGQQQIWGRLILLRDITMRKEIENELFAQKQLSEIMVSVSWAATQAIDLDAAMNNVVQTAVSLTKAKVGSLILINSNQQITRTILAQADGELIVQKVDDLQRIIDKGVAGWVARQRSAALIPDTHDDERWLQLQNKPNRTRSVLAVPIIESDEVMGVLTMTHTSPQHFTEQNRLFLQAAANQMSLALRNAQNYENQRRLAQNQSTLYQVLQTMSGHLHREDVLNSAAEAITQLTTWAAISILILDEAGSQFISHVSTGNLRHLDDGHFDVAKGIWGRALRRGTTQVVPNIHEDPDFVGGYAALNSALAIPIYRRGQQLGVLYLESHQKDRLNIDDRWLADSLAEAIALAVDNAQTHDSLRQYAADLSTLYSITRLVSRSLVDENVLERALYMALTSLQFDMGVLVLANSDGILRLVSERGLPERLSEQLYGQKVTGTISDYIYQQQRTVHVPDISQANNELEKISQLMPTALHELQQLGASAFYGIPLQHQEQFLGVLCLFAHQPRPLPSLTAQALHEAIGQQISTAVSNIHLYEQTRQQLKEQTALRQAITAITSSLDLPTVLAPNCPTDGPRSRLHQCLYL